MSDKEKEKEKEKSSSTAAAGGDSKPGDLGLLEEDDEFEEFPAEGKKHCMLSGDLLILDLDSTLF